MAGEFGLFNYPTPERVRESIGKTEMDTLGSQYGGGGFNEKLFKAAMGAGAMTGGGIATGLGYESPEVKVAKKQKAVSDLIASSDIDMGTNPVGFLEMAAKAYQDADMLPQAMQAMTKATELKLVNAKTAKAKATDTKRSAIAQLQLDRDRAVSENRTKDAKAISKRIEKENYTADNKWRQVLNPILAKIRGKKKISPQDIATVQLMAITRDSPITVEMKSALATVQKQFEEINKAAGVTPIKLR